jgi:hypothetical protein
MAVKVGKGSGKGLKRREDRVKNNKDSDHLLFLRGEGARGKE